MTDEVKPEKQEIIRNPDGTFKKGASGHPEGRPKGKTLKEWVREKLSGMTDAERENFLKDIDKETQWKMAEGNPKTELSNDPDNPFVLKVINYGDNNSLPVPSAPVPNATPDEQGKIQDSGVAQEVWKEQNISESTNSENAVEKGDILLRSSDIPPSETSNLG